MYRTFLLSLSILLTVLSVSSNDIAPTIRQTVNGPVEGVEKISSLGQKYYSFRGIPFAEAPITGTDPYTSEQVDRRFKAPESLKRRWTEVLKAHNFEKVCIQRDVSIDQTKMGENCLFLNVHVPADGSKQKTVLVWIHGGGFNMGDSTDDLFGPDFLLSQDNILVTINYRLGIFGFLNLNFGEYTGNMGLKDQQLALKWVHENIEHFSGNKSEVLLFGQSSGSVSVQLQMLNKESRSYFQRAFAASGSIFQSYVFTKANQVQTIQGCSNATEMDKLIKYLKTENTSALLNCPNLEEPISELNLVWSPVIEKNDTKNVFLTKTPEEIYNGPTEEAPIMDAMFSFTGQEVSLAALNISSPESLVPLIKENVMETTHMILPFKDFSKTTHPKEYEEALKKIKKAYFSNITNVDAIERTNADLMSQYYEIIKMVAIQSNVNRKSGGRKNTFLFRFNVTADLNLASLTETKSSNARHSDDICYLFHCHGLDEMKKYDKHLEQRDFHYDLIMRSVKMITNFARTGDPSIEGDTPFKSSKSIDEMFCHEVANELKTSVTHDIRQQSHYDVWHEIDEVYKTLNV